MIQPYAFTKLSKVGWRKGIRAGFRNQWVKTREGSNPSLTTINAPIAHLVERDLAKVEVMGSSPIWRSNFIGQDQGVAKLGIAQHLGC